MARSRLNNGKAVSVAIAIIIGAILIAFILPILETGPNDTRVSDEEYEVGIVKDVSSSLTITLNDISGGSTIDLTLTDSQNANNVTITDLGEGETQNVTLSGESIEVTNVEVTSSSTALIITEYPVAFGWDTQTLTLFGITGLLLIGYMLFVTVGWSMMVWKGK